MSRLNEKSCADAQNDVAFAVTIRRGNPVKMMFASRLKKGSDLKGKLLYLIMNSFILRVVSFSEKVWCIARQTGSKTIASLVKNLLKLCQMCKAT